MPPTRRPADEIRGEITRAVIDVIAERGMGALTHRAVAQHAGVSLSSTTYHFASKSDMVAAALEAFAEHDRRRSARQLRELQLLRERGEEVTPALVAELLVHVVEGASDPRVRAGYELQLWALDEPQLRETVRSWFDDVASTLAGALTLLGSPQPAVDARVVVAAVDGLRLDALATDATAERRAEHRAAVERLVSLVTAGSAR